MKIAAEYIWLDGTPNTSRLRSKTKMVDLSTLNGHAEPTLADFPEWGFDGSSTGQAEGHDSDCILKPVAFVPSPFDGESALVLCEVYSADGTPHPTNTRATLRGVLDAGAESLEPWFGIEQEYFLWKDGRALGWPETGEPAPQFPFYCGVGSTRVAGRDIVIRHREACLHAGLLYEGTNFEVALGQAEFQIGTGTPLEVADHLWLGRYILERVAEEFDVDVNWEPKPYTTDINGSGAHTNFSTAATRTPRDGKATGDWVENEIAKAEGTLPEAPWGMDAIVAICEKLATKREEHIAVYGYGIEQRLTGKHETCSYLEFKYGVANRAASIRIPRHVADKGYGYLEDRRPCSNMDPYLVCARILQTVCEP